MANPFGQRNYGGWCQCSECGRTFGGLEGFDAHKIVIPNPDGYDWRCAMDAEIKAKGLRLSGKGWWVRKAPSAPRRSTRTAAGIDSSGGDQK